MNEYTREILSSITDYFVCLDREFRIVALNLAAERILGRPESEFLGKTHWEAFPASVGSEAEKQYRRAMTDGVAVNFEHHYVEPGVYDFWLEIHVYPSHDGINILSHDISRRKKAEEELGKFQFLADHAADAFFLLDAQGRFVYVNEAACHALGYIAADFGRMRALDIDPAYDEATYRALFQRASGERLPPFESIHRRADGTELPIEASVSRLDVGGQPLLFSSCRDISERKTAERELRQSAVRQQHFLRDVLASVTEGRLILCQSEAEIPAPLEPYSEAITLMMSGGLSDLRRVTSDACQSQGLSDERCHDLITAASEAGMNASVHAGAGTGQVFVNNRRHKVQVRVTDLGPGIPLENLPHATLRKGFTTAGTLGHGMKMMLQTADRVYLLTGPDGTTVVIEQERTAEAPRW